MRCRTCNYSLWNLTTRQCPECGAAFKPSEFEFTPGSVRFHCPHCNKAYYGTDEHGHLVPRAFICVGCGKPIDMDETVLSPAQGVAEEQTIPVELPWLVRTRKGTIRSFARTCWWAMSRPSDLGRSIPVSGSAPAAWWFLVISQIVAWTLLMGSYVGLVAIPMLIVPAGRAAGAAGTMLSVFGVTLILVLIFFALIAVPIWGLIAHLILRGTGETRGTLGLTFSSLCYSSGANLPTGVPFIGYLFGPIWWLVSATLTVKESQRVSGGRAALAVLPMPIIGGLLLIGGYVALISMAVSTARMAATTAASAAQSAAMSASEAAKTQAVTMLLIQEISRDPKGAPDPISLVTGGFLTPQSLIWQSGQTNPDTWMISGVPLSNLPLLMDEEIRQMRYRLSQAPHADSDAGELRLGDMVFLYGKNDMRSADPALWLTIMWPDPKFNQIEDPSWEIWVGRADGSTFQLTPASFDASLATQNQLREKSGLKALRHPREVR